MISTDTTAETTQPVREPKLSQTEVWRQYHLAGRGKTAEEDIVKQYHHLVKTVVGKLAMNLPSHVDLDDLQSAGMLGLLNAVRNYKPGIVCPFQAYARLGIRGQVLDELSRMDWVPRSVHVKARKVQAVMAQLET